MGNSTTSVGGSTNTSEGGYCWFTRREALDSDGFSESSGEAIAFPICSLHLLQIAEWIKYKLKLNIGEYLLRIINYLFQYRPNIHITSIWPMFNWDIITEPTLSGPNAPLLLNTWIFNRNVSITYSIHYRNTCAIHGFVCKSFLAVLSFPPRLFP